MTKLMSRQFVNRTLASIIGLVGWSFLSAALAQEPQLELLPESRPATEDPSDGLGGDPTKFPDANSLSETQPLNPEGGSWPKSQSNQGKPPGLGFSSAREMLELRNVDGSQLSRLLDRRPLHIDEHEVLYRLLYVLPKFPPDLVWRWSHEVDWSSEKEKSEQSLLDDPMSCHAEFFRLQGYAIRVETVSILPEAAQLLEYSEYYRVEMEVDGLPDPVAVCVRVIPKAWKIDTKMHEPASIRALFLKDGAEDGLIFAGNRMAWHPKNQVLGALGVDVGLFDQVRHNNKWRSSGARHRDVWSHQGRELLFQSLAVLKETDVEKLQEQSSDEVPIGEILQKPREQQGRFFTIKGTARRATKILVKAPDVRERFGIDHYWEVDVFMPLEPPLKISLAGNEDVKASFRSYPVIVVVPELPEGMESGDEIVERVEITACFMRLSSYKSEYMSNLQEDYVQVSPILIGTLSPLSTESHAINEQIGMIVGGLFVIAMAGIWLGLWRYKRGDSEFAQTTLKRIRKVDTDGDMDMNFDTEADYGLNFDIDEESRD